MRSEGEELLPEVLFELPEVCCLSGEGGPMHLAEGREPLAVVSSEVSVECLVGVEPQEFADHFDGEDLRIGKLRSGTALADAPPFELVVDEAKDGDDEGAKIHERRPPFVLDGLEHHRA